MSGVFGNKPSVPTYIPTNPAQVQGQTIAGNAQNLGAAEQLAGNVDTFNQQQLEAMYSQALPGYDSIKNSVASNIGSEVNGQIPTSVQSQILSGAAAHSVYGGYGGSGLSGNLSARDLGLTSLDLTQMGQNAATSWLSANTAPRMDVSSMFLNPTQGVNWAIQQNQAQWDQEWLQAQVAGMPDPTSAGTAKFFGSILSLGMGGSAFGGSGGSGGGGFGGGGGGGGGGGSGINSFLGSTSDTENSDGSSSSSASGLAAILAML